MFTNRIQCLLVSTKNLLYYKAANYNINYINLLEILLKYFYIEPLYSYLNQNKVLIAFCWQYKYLPYSGYNEPSRCQKLLIYLRVLRATTSVFDGLFFTLNVK